MLEGLGISAVFLFHGGYEIWQEVKATGML
jgi:hypothetical protein